MDPGHEKLLQSVDSIIGTVAQLCEQNEALRQRVARLEQRLLQREIEAALAGDGPSTAAVERAKRLMRDG